MTPSDFTERAGRCLQEVRGHISMHVSMSTTGFLSACNEFIVAGLLKNVTSVPGEVFFLIKTTLYIDESQN